MSLIESLAAQPDWLAEQVIRSLGDRDAIGADRHFANWAHDGQMPPPDDWAVWVVKGGRGFGKTRAGAEWITAAARAHRRAGAQTLRIALVAATLGEARRVMIEGESGLLAVAGDEIEAWLPSLRTLRFRGNAEATIFSGAAPEALRGAQHHLAWCDELAKWRRAEESWNMLRLGLRLPYPARKPAQGGGAMEAGQAGGAMGAGQAGGGPRVLVTTTPRPGSVLTRVMAERGCVVTGGPTRDNIHLSARFIEAVHALYAGTRLERQELEGELLPDAAGALWTAELIERCRARADAKIEATRIVIGVDPPTGDGTCGIVACARDGDGVAHVLADHSVSGRSPDGWARAVADAARIHAATAPVLVVAEQNQGGKMVAFVLRAGDSALPLKLVNATEGKSARADPVARLFEAGKARLAGRFPDLEAELRGFVAGGGYDGPGASPDRADAMVWAMTALMLQAEPPPPRIRQL